MVIEGKMRKRAARVSHFIRKPAAHTVTRLGICTSYLILDFSQNSAHRLDKRGVFLDHQFSNCHRSN